MRTPPRGLQAKLWRFPITLYKIGLGWLFGQRFMLLTHTGRKSGLQRQAVIEVVHHDADSDTWYAASGFGEKSHWYRNIMVNPQVELQIGRQRFAAQARRVSVDEAEKALAVYARKHPTALKQLSQFMGIPFDGTPQGLRHLAETLPIIAFHVQKGATQ